MVLNCSVPVHSDSCFLQERPVEVVAGPELRPVLDVGVVQEPVQEPVQVQEPVRQLGNRN